MISKINILFVLILIVRSSFGFSHPTKSTTKLSENFQFIKQTQYTPISISLSSTRLNSIPFLIKLRGGNQQEVEEIEQEVKQEIETELINLSQDSPVSIQTPTKSNIFNKDQLLSAVAIPMVSFSKFYSASLQRSPILTKSITAGIIFTLSDILAQKLEKNDKPKKLQIKRIIASAIVGFAYFGPAAHYWYEWIFHIIPGTTLINIIQKATLGQCLFGPCFTCVFFASSLIQSNNFTINKWFIKIKNDLPSAFIAGAGFWPIIDLISYSYVPPTYIPLFINFCSLIWTTFLALKSYSK